MGASPSPSPDAEISIGSVLDGRYRIDAVLGTGGMGRVYRGEHTGIGRAVAIKVLHADLGRNREAAQRFQREAIASGRLDHPNIVGVSDFGVVDDGPCYLVMEALEGESLGERLERERRIPWTDAIEIMRGVLHGLRHAHDRGVVHRDIKPDNVFLARKDGEVIVKILDFGIAKLYAGSPDDPASTRAGLTVGTPAYLSPEQAVGGEIKPASDLYSATILLFEMLTGRAPFEDKDPLAMLGAHVSRQPPRVDEVAPDVRIPPQLEAVIQHGLVKTQNDRISTANDYLAALDGVMASAKGSGPALQFLGTPVGVSALGTAPTAYSQAAYATPPPVSLTSGTLTPAPGPLTPQGMTPHPFTPVPGTIGSLSALDNDATVITPPSHPVALGPPPALPHNWIKVAVIVIVVAVLVAIALKMAASGGSGAIKAPKPTTPEVKPTKPERPTKPEPKPDPKAYRSQGGGGSADVAETKTVDKPPDPTPPVPPVVEPTSADTSSQLATLLDDLANGKSCPERRKAVAALALLGDKEAIPALKKARRRMRGGLLGIGSSNANHCLKKDAEAAIKSLGGTLK